MALTPDWPNRIIESTASITDLPAFHAALRGLEADATGAVYPVIHTWKALDLGGGAYFYQADIINSYRLKFIGAGPFQIAGNLNCTIIDTGVQVERKTSAAFSTTSVGGSGPSASDIAGEVWARIIGARSAGDQLQRISSIVGNKMVTDPATGTLTVYGEDDTTPILSAPIYKDAAGTTPYDGTGAERRERLA